MKILKVFVGVIVVVVSRWPGSG